MAGTPAKDLQCLCVKDLELLARERMNSVTKAYYNEGSDNNTTLKENQEAFEKYRIRPRVLRDVSVIDTTSKVFDQVNTVPFGVAPTAMQKLAHELGEIATAHASKKAGIVMGLSSFSTSTLEDVAEASGSNANVLQLYMFEEKDHSVKLIERAKTAGYKAVLLTVDTPVLGNRRADLRNQFKLPSHLSIPNFAPGPDDFVEDTMAQTKERKPSYSGYHDGEKRVLPVGPITFHTHAANPTLTWDDIAFLKEVAHPMQVWVKGVATAEDALLAIEHKTDGIIVSNHGGRQLDGAMATLDALPDIVEVVRGRIPVHVDGGFRNGTDIFKALALGADFVWIGRPVLWGLAYKGEEGVALCLRLLSDEFRLCMALSGVTKVSDINKSYLVKVNRDGFVSKL